MQVWSGGQNLGDFGAHGRLARLRSQRQPVLRGQPHQGDCSAHTPQARGLRRARPEAAELRQRAPGAAPPGQPLDGRRHGQRLRRPPGGPDGRTSTRRRWCRGGSGASGTSRGIVQDSWKARRNLTIEAGLRVAKLTNNEELNGLGLRFEPSAYDSTQGAFIDGDPQRPNGVLLARRGEIPKGMTPNPGIALMPRLNVAWDVRGTGDLVLRGGAGLFYNRPMGNYQYFIQTLAPEHVQHPRELVGAWTGASPSRACRPSTPTPARPRAGWTRSTPGPSTCPGPGTGASASPSACRGGRPWKWPTSATAPITSRTARIANYIAPGKLTGTVGNADLDNPLHRVALDESVAATFRNYPAYSQDSWWWQYEAVSRYNALQATLSRPGTRVQYFLNYTFSKVLGTTGAGDYAVIDPLDAAQPQLRRGPRGTGRTSSTRPTTSSCPIPFGRRQPRPARPARTAGRSRASRATGAAIPFHVTFSGDILEDPGDPAGLVGHRRPQHTRVERWQRWRSVTPVLLGNPQLGNTKVGEKILDIDKIAIPAFGESGPFQSPYYLRAPSRWNFDVSVFKNFKMGGSKTPAAAGRVLQPLQPGDAGLLDRRHRPQPADRVQRSRRRRPERRGRDRGRRLRPEPGLPLHGADQAELRQDRDQARPPGDRAGRALRLLAPQGARRISVWAPALRRHFSLGEPPHFGAGRHGASHQPELQGTRRPRRKRSPSARGVAVVTFCSRR